MSDEDSAHSNEQELRRLLSERLAAFALASQRKSSSNQTRNLPTPALPANYSQAQDMPIEHPIQPYMEELKRVHLAAAAGSLENALRILLCTLANPTFRLNPPPYGQSTTSNSNETTSEVVSRRPFVSEENEAPDPNVFVNKILAIQQGMPVLDGGAPPVQVASRGLETSQQLQARLLLQFLVGINNQQQHRKQSPVTPKPDLGNETRELVAANFLVGMRDKLESAVDASGRTRISHRPRASIGIDERVTVADKARAGNHSLSRIFATVISVAAKPAPISLRERPTEESCRTTSGSSSSDLCVIERRSAREGPEAFPQKLYRLLEEAVDLGNEDIVSWMPMKSEVRFHKLEQWKVERCKVSMTQGLFAYSFFLNCNPPFQLQDSVGPFKASVLIVYPNYTDGQSIRGTM
jgi:hypothetical protein